MPDGVTTTSRHGVERGTAGPREAGACRSTDEVGFEPTVRYERTHTFQACALNHSATRPGSCDRPDTPPNDDAPAVPAHRVLHGQSEIRTHDTVAGTPVFETGAFNHSAICPSSPSNLDGRRHWGNGRMPRNPALGQRNMSGTQSLDGDGHSHRSPCRTPRHAGSDRRYCRRDRKNSVSTAPHSAASTPPCTSGR